MGKVTVPKCPSYLRVEPFAVQFWALGIVYLPAPEPARRPGITPPPYTKHVLIWS